MVTIAGSWCRHLGSSRVAREFELVDSADCVGPLVERSEQASQSSEPRGRGRVRCGGPSRTITSGAHAAADAHHMMTVVHDMAWLFRVLTFGQ